ncbi:hypothetical protein TGPRC2_311075 [Toxoplasma gondii TgCatPRC2]|uniref:Uncharacterized protein n=11 Tax=Toxoplasma gondii TaxID=5811 RepID=S7UTS8_TOXGG|nr:hypothetical protein TGGT1_311075 [Toxoplasma gondii GT1]KAF4639286.1 hypothetical protein TGRH88_050580 [Toxoplasma gondii]KFG41058.1 hypothetical protein TGP89_311075 [Toxoplasma gondii p89]KFG44421.1 hypothetical protein TGDOM2_311075 [Toxoplasma gondii GAB2-2007-GAL-DOM2]KFG55885.1 hypothetical protein TGFOU_311075 [Toxoplasma gondii FOU]KFG65873.1 hypothetical protein TGRUB_311075 [Toxoplasma gondii RUB]KFH02244.1 hypothetical protein TGVAND_311075 [Toxoplasma gondii VAND]KFH18030.1 
MEKIPITILPHPGEEKIRKRAWNQHWLSRCAYTVVQRSVPDPTTPVCWRKEPRVINGVVIWRWKRRGLPSKKEPRLPGNADTAQSTLFRIAHGKRHLTSTAAQEPPVARRRSSRLHSETSFAQFFEDKRDLTSSDEEEESA